MGLKNVTCHERFVRIVGKLATYRVHMVSGVIHKEPGNYLCIVSSRRGVPGKNIYLPFSEPEERTREIISKILLLVNDDKIEDELILQQI